MSQFLFWLISWDGLAFVLMMICYFFFVREIKKPGSQEKVNLATWISWGLLDTILFFAMLETDTLLGTMPAYVLGVSWVVVTAVRKGAIFAPTWMDFFCAAIVGLAIGWWFIRGGPQGAIVLVAFGCAVATVPLVQHLLKEPRANSLTAWLFGLAGTGAAIFAVKKWSFEWVEIVNHWLIPVTFFGLSVVVVGVLLTRFLPKHKVAGPQRRALPVGYIG